MGTFHMIYGILLILLVIIVTIMEIIRPTGVPKGLRRATIGLLDLQIVIGIITWIIVKPSMQFIAHPIFMVAAVVVAHIYTRSGKMRSRRATGWIIASVLLILGAALFHN